MKYRIWITCIALVGLTGLFLLYKNKEKFGGDMMAEFQSISMEEAKAIFAQPGEYVILDVRRADEFAAGHIPGAMNIANEDIDTVQPEELPDMAQTIYVYCRSGNRSRQAAAKLVRMGYTNIVECGGILDWTGAMER